MVPFGRAFPPNPVSDTQPGGRPSARWHESSRDTQALAGGSRPDARRAVPETQDQVSLLTIGLVCAERQRRGHQLLAQRERAGHGYHPAITGTAAAITNAERSQPTGGAKYRPADRAGEQFPGAVSSGASSCWQPARRAAPQRR